MQVLENFRYSYLVFVCSLGPLRLLCLEFGRSREQGGDFGGERVFRARIVESSWMRDFVRWVF